MNPLQRIQAWWRRRQGQRQLAQRILADPTYLFHMRLMGVNLDVDQVDKVLAALADPMLATVVFGAHLQCQRDNLGRLVVLRQRKEIAQPWQAQTK